MCWTGKCLQFKTKWVSFALELYIVFLKQIWIFLYVSTTSLGYKWTMCFLASCQRLFVSSRVQYNFQYFEQYSLKKVFPLEAQRQLSDNSNLFLLKFIWYFINTVHVKYKSTYNIPFCNISRWHDMSNRLCTTVQMSTQISFTLVKYNWLSYTGNKYHIEKSQTFAELNLCKLKFKMYQQILSISSSNLECR